MTTDEIKQSVSMLEVAERYGYHPNRAGFISCPFHKEKTASFSISPRKQIWHCFGCGKGGDSISLVSELLNKMNVNKPNMIDRVYMNSKMLSADVDAGYDPIYKSVTELNNASFIGNGITINKYN